ncbi:MAG: hypothetical protein ABW196_10695 [Solirubrobacterales bacterium]
MAKVWIGNKSRASYLRRLAVVFADELRLKIVTELYMREMSPSAFHAEFGGGSVTRVDRHFKRLAEHGWLRFVRRESGGRRRGGKEHFYRATELAVFDNETWSMVPYSIRVAFSWRTFGQLAERVREALQAGTFDARADSHLSWTPLLLDQLGWDQLIAAVDQLFETIFEEQADAKLRIFDSGEQPILATTAMALFESPRRHGPGGQRDGGSTLVEGASCAVPFPLRVSKVFADELCLEIVAETNLREMSARQFHEEVGGASVDGIRRRFKMLAEIGWLSKVGEKRGGRRRGAVEYFYRATGPAIFDNVAWADVPDPVKATYSWRTFGQLSDQVKKAIEAGTFEARTDNHLSWSLLRLDQRGWERVAAAVDALFAVGFEVQEEAKLRISSSGEQPISTTLALAAFESPKDSVKAP